MGKNNTERVQQTWRTSIVCFCEHYGLQPYWKGIEDQLYRIAASAGWDERKVRDKLVEIGRALREVEHRTTST